MATTKTFVPYFHWIHLRNSIEWRNYFSCWIVRHSLGTESSSTLVENHVFGLFSHVWATHLPFFNLSFVRNIIFLLNYRFLQNLRIFLVRIQNDQLQDEIGLQICCLVHFPLPVSYMND